MGDALVSRYWCYMCEQMVNPVMEVEIKCPFCQGGFVVEMENRRDQETELGSDRALSLWAPVLLGMMGGPSSRRRIRRGGEEENSEGDSEEDRGIEAVRRRRRRSSSAILQSLHGVRVASESENSENERERDRDRERERVILISPFNRAIILRGSFDFNQSTGQNQNPPGSLGDYFIGPGLDTLLQHLAENDPNRYGTPPAQKEAVEALPTVKIAENLQCSVCLEDFSIGSEAKELPCKHKFHDACILPWLELHSSCPVCRFQLPADDGSKDQDRPANSNRVDRTGDGGERSEGETGNRDENGNENENGSGNGNGNGRRFWIPVPWPFNGLFSLSGSQSGGNSSSSSPSSGNTRTDEN